MVNLRPNLCLFVRHIIKSKAGKSVSGKTKHSGKVEEWKKHHKKPKGRSPTTYENKLNRTIWWLEGHIPVYKLMILVI